jgi:hypothetical protein
MNRDNIADKIARFFSIFIPYPPHSEFQERCDYQIKLGRATRGLAQKGMRTLAPSGSGKTTAAEAFVRRFEAVHPRTDTYVPIVLIALERATTAKKLMMSILDYFGDNYSSSGNEQTLKKRVKACFERFGTELLMIDEVQHLNVRHNSQSDVTDSLKRLLDDGVVPIVFLGTDDALDLFTRNLQLSGRLIAPCDFRKLEYENAGDRGLLAGYALLLDQAMVDRGIMPELSGLNDQWVLGCLFEVSDGVIGRVSRLVGAALEIALHRDATQVEVHDLSLAVDRWAIPNGFVSSNPFLQERPQ